MEFTQPSQVEIVEVLRQHRLVKLRERVVRAFLVGSFCTGKERAESDVDILLEVQDRRGVPAHELEDHYRAALRQYFVTNGIQGKCDSVHPQWQGRRVDLYFTYDADSEPRPKRLLERLPIVAAPMKGPKP